jgi:hypothetical protein
MVWCLFPCPLPSNLSGRNSKVNKKSVVTGRLQLLAQKKKQGKTLAPKGNGYYKRAEEKIQQCKTGLSHLVPGRLFD